MPSCNAIAYNFICPSPTPVSGILTEGSACIEKAGDNFFSIGFSESLRILKYKYKIPTLPRNSKLLEDLIILIVMRINTIVMKNRLKKVDFKVLGISVAQALVIDGIF